MQNAHDPRAPAALIRQEVRENVLAQRIGRATVADLALPDGLVLRIVDRVICSSFEERYRITVAVALPAPSAPFPTSSPPPPGGAPGWRVIEPAPTEPALPPSWKEERPVNRAWIAPLEADGSGSGPHDQPAPDDADACAACELVARRLAHDGLLATLSAALQRLGRDRTSSAASDLAMLVRSLGFPVDLLAQFDIASEPDVGALSVEPRAERALRHVADRVFAPGFDPTRDLAGLTFRFRASEPGFRASSDAGERPAAMVRLQMTRGDYWAGPGSGDNLDLATAMLRELPETAFLVSLRHDHLDGFVQRAAGVRPANAADVTVLPHDSIVSQWAQDNIRTGFAGDPGTPTACALVPRYPSRGDDGSVFVPGEHAVVRGLARAGIRLVRSALLFQGGNLIVSPDPLSPGRRLALIGEGEIARNVSLGLTVEQAVEAFKEDLRVDRVEVLPAISYHIDYEVCVRAFVRAEGEAPAVAAFVNDTPGAVRVILACVIDAIERARALPKPRLRAARQHLRAEKWMELVELLGSGFFAPEVSLHLGLTESFARIFSSGPGDNGVATCYRALLAVDIVSSWLSSSLSGPMQAHALAYFDSFRRCEADRARLRERLAGLGFVVAPVPSLAHSDRSVNAINGVHLPDRYLMPAWGGVLKPLDDAASLAFRSLLGAGVKIIPIPSAESQCRNGAVHCSTSVF